MKIISIALLACLLGSASYAEQEKPIEQLSSPIEADLIRGHGATPKQIEEAKVRGAESAKRDIKSGIFRILHFGKPRSVGKPLIDETTGYRVQIVAGCSVTAEFVEEVRAYNAIMKNHHKKSNKQIEIDGENATHSPASHS